MTTSRQNFTSFLLLIMWLMVYAAVALGGMGKLLQKDKKFNCFPHAAIKYINNWVFCPFYLVHLWMKPWKRFLKLEQGWQMHAFKAMPGKAMCSLVPLRVKFWALDLAGHVLGYLPTKHNCLLPALSPAWLLLCGGGFAAFVTPQGGNSVRSGAWRLTDLDIV